VATSTGTIIQRPEAILDGADAIASLTWQAYNAMETTKRRHFELLEILDNKKKNYNLDATEREQGLLACLLRDHDEQVRRFTEASKALKLRDATAHTALFTYIGSINSDIIAAPVTH